MSEPKQAKLVHLREAAQWARQHKSRVDVEAEVLDGLADEIAYLRAEVERQRRDATMDEVRRDLDDGEIKRLRAALAQEQADHDTCEHTYDDREAGLLRAITAIAEKNAAMREVVAAVARGLCYVAEITGRVGGAKEVCGGCGAVSDLPSSPDHHDDCIVIAARALMADESEAES